MPLGFLAYCLCIVAWSQFGSYFFGYWELDSISFRARSPWTWSLKEVPWEEVTHVRSLPSGPYSGGFLVEHTRPAPMLDSGHILANPRDREQFIAALRRYAPQATFEV